MDDLNDDTHTYLVNPIASVSSNSCLSLIDKSKLLQRRRIDLNCKSLICRIVLNSWQVVDYKMALYCKVDGINWFSLLILQSYKLYSTILVMHNKLCGTPINMDTMKSTSEGQFCDTVEDKQWNGLKPRSIWKVRFGRVMTFLKYILET